MDGAELAAWQRRMRFTDAEAAARLGLSVTSLWRKRTGRSPVDRQTELLVDYVTLFDPLWLDIAEVALKLSRAHCRAR